MIKIKAGDSNGVIEIYVDPNMVWQYSAPSEHNFAACMQINCEFVYFDNGEDAKEAFLQIDRIKQGSLN